MPPKEKEEVEKKSYGYENIDFNLKKELNEISFRNSQIGDIRKMQLENASLKEMVGKKPAKKSGLSTIKGMGTLKGFNK